ADDASDTATAGCVVWDAVRCEQKWDAIDRHAALASAAFARARPMFACALGKTVRCQAVPSFEPTGAPIVLPAEPEMIALSPDGRLVAVKLDGRVELYDTEHGKTRHKFV